MDQDTQQKPESASSEEAVVKNPEVEEEKKTLGKVLMVEDDLPMAKMYSTKLQMEGFEVEVAHNGEEGVEKIKQGNYDLVMLDLMIPKLGGMEVLAQLREDKGKDLPVIILSNLSQEEDIKKAHELGVKDFLVKSNHTPGEIVKIVKSYF